MHMHHAHAPCVRTLHQVRRLATIRGDRPGRPPAAAQADDPAARRRPARHGDRVPVGWRAAGAYGRGGRVGRGAVVRPPVLAGRSTYCARVRVRIRVSQPTMASLPAR
eukprot:scaffold84580_cov69-Phaeocystis_antarctica.AAC.6